MSSNVDDFITYNASKTVRRKILLQRWMSSILDFTAQHHNNCACTISLNLMVASCYKSCLFAKFSVEILTGHSLNGKNWIISKLKIRSLSNSNKFIRISITHAWLTFLSIRLWVHNSVKLIHVKCLLCSTSYRNTRESNKKIQLNTWAYLSIFALVGNTMSPEKSQIK